MINSTNLHGIIPAIPTPVLNGRIDESAVAALFQWLNATGVDGVLPIGGTGEYGALTAEDRIKMVELSARGMNGKGPVIAGLLDTGYHDAMNNGRAFAAAGADALLAIPPYYTNPTQAGIRDYFMRFADESPVPILLYEIPYRTRFSMKPEVIHELSRHERIIGMKACNTDMFYFLQIVAGVDASFAVLSGEDTIFPLQVAAGAVGGMIVLPTLLPKAWRQIFDLARSGQVKDALDLHREFIPLIKMAFAETNPGPVKSVMDLIGVDRPELLAPLVAPAQSLREPLRAEVTRLLAKFETAGSKNAA